MGMVDSGRATDPPASISAFVALSGFAGSSIPYSGARTGVAAPLLLDMSCSAPNSIGRKTAGWKSSSHMACRLSGIYLRGLLVPRKLLLDLSDDALLRKSLGARIRWSFISVRTLSRTISGTVRAAVRSYSTQLESDRRAHKLAPSLGRGRVCPGSSYWISVGSARLYADR